MRAAELVLAAIVRRGEDVLLVRSRDPFDPARSWWCVPGGGVDPGETLGQALEREIGEETGLRVTAVDGFAYAVHLDNRRSSSRSLVLVLEARVGPGRVRPRDPDGEVLEGGFFPLAEALMLVRATRWGTVRDPLVSYLTGEAGPGCVWYYRWDRDGDERLVDRWQPGLTRRRPGGTVG